MVTGWLRDGQIAMGQMVTGQIAKGRTVGRSG